MTTAIYTIVSNNYLHFARTLLQSARVQHPECQLYCVIVDSDESPARALGDEFEFIGLRELGLPAHDQFLFQYSVLELNTAVKPWAMEALLKKGHDSVIYIDPDIRLYRPLQEVLSAFEDGSDIVITPHLLAPITDDLRPTELDIRRAGTYNFGFCAVRSSENTLRFLHWWQGKLERGCVVDFERGIFVDQSWIDLVPGLFENVTILRHPGYNVAYWNLAQRSISRDASSQWLSNGEPLVFFHYSGLNPLNPEPFSKHQNRFTLSTLGPVTGLVQDYVADVKRNGVEQYSRLPYGFGCFRDGTRISDAFRKTYLGSEKLRQQMGSDPFACPDALSWYAEKSPSCSLPMTWAMRTIWESRSDLRATFPLTDDSSIYLYWLWFIDQADTYFDAPVAEKHRRIFDTLRAPAHRRDHASPTQVNPSTSRVHSIFINLLGRAPGPRGVAYLAPWCKNKLGASLVLLVIAATPESRARGNILKRTRQAFRRLFAGSTAPRPDASMQAERDSSGHRAVTYAGIYPPDGDSAVNGLWCAQVVDIPLPTGDHQRLTVTGNFVPELHRRATKTKDVKMRIFLDSTLIREKVLPETGAIDLAIEVPSESAQAQVLRIELNSSFVPAQVIKNGDARNLAWRIVKAACDQCTMVDVSRTIQLLPVSELRPADGFNLVGYLAAELGVGEGARTMARAAHTADIKYSIVDVGYQSSNRQADRSAWQQAQERVFDVDIVYVNADQTSNTLRYLNEVGHPRPKVRIGYWHWEQPKLPEKYLDAFDGLDEIWVPTSFVQHAVAAISPVPVFKVPHAVEFSVDPTVTRSAFGIPENSYAVLVMYDFHSYRYRKNPEAAIAAYRMAAGKREDACLVVKTINAEHYAEDYRRLKESVSDLPNVIFLDAVYSRSMLYALEACCDCMMSLHRAEGFGLGPAEMMYLGKPVIATGWSGNMEFMNSMNSFPVNYVLKPLEHAVGVYEPGLEWAEPDIEHAAHSLSRLLSDPTLGKDIGRHAKATVESSLSPRVIGEQYRARLALITARLH